MGSISLSKTEFECEVAEGTILVVSAMLNALCPSPPVCAKYADRDNICNGYND